MRITTLFPHTSGARSASETGRCQEPPPFVWGALLAHLGIEWYRGLLETPSLHVFAPTQMGGSGLASGLPGSLCSPGTGPSRQEAKWGVLRLLWEATGPAG